MRLLLTTLLALSQASLLPGQDPSSENLSASLQFERDRTGESLLASADLLWQQGDEASAIQNWQAVLDLEEDPFVLVEGVFRSGWEVAGARLATLPESASERIERTVGARAEQDVRAAQQSSNPDTLLRRAIQFRHTSAGQRVWQHLVAQARDRGEHSRAQRLLESWQAGRSPSVIRDDAGTGTALEQAQSPPPDQNHDSTPEHAPDPASFAKQPAWQHVLPLPPEVEQFAQESLAELDAQGIAPLLSAQPVCASDHVIVRTLSGVAALDALTGDVVWQIALSSSMDLLVEASSSLSDVLRRVSAERSLTHRLMRDSLSEALVVDDERAYVLVPRESARTASAELDESGQPLTLFPEHSLVALSITNGRELWRAGDARSAAESPAHATVGTISSPQDVTFLGPPCRDETSLLVVVEADAVVSLYSLEASTGVREWSVPLGRAVRPVTLDPLRQSRACPVLIHQGRAYCATGAGAVVCVDLVSRRRLWGLRLGRDELPDKLGALTDQPEHVPGPTSNTWHRATLAAADDTFVMAVPENDWMYAVDTSSGELRWKRPRNDGLFVLPPADGIVTVIGADTATGVHTQTGEVVWTAHIPRPAGEGWTHAGEYIFPVQPTGLVSLRLSDGSVRPLSGTHASVSAGARLLAESGGSFREVFPRNVVPCGTHLLVQSFDRIESYAADERPLTADDRVAASRSPETTTPLSRSVNGASGVTPSALWRYFVEFQQPHRTVRLDRWLTGIGEDFLGSSWPRLLRTLQGRGESAETNASAHETHEIDEWPPVSQGSWPSRRPLVTESTSPFDYLQLAAVPVTAPRRSPWNRITVSVDRQGRSVWFDDGENGKPWRVSLPPDRSNTRADRRLDRAWALESLLVLRVGTELFGVRPFTNDGRRSAAIVWPPRGESLDLRGERPPLLISLTETGSIEEEQASIYEDRFGRPIGEVGPVGEEFLCYQERSHLVVLDPQDGTELWRRSDLPVGTTVVGGPDAIVLLNPSRTSGEVLRPLDGRRMRILDQLPSPATVMLQSAARWLIAEPPDPTTQGTGEHPPAEDAAANTPLALQRFDLGTGHVRWSIPLAAGSRVFEVDDAWFGVLTDNKLQFLDWETGSTIRTDSMALPPGDREVHVVTDAERVMVFVSAGVSDQRVVLTNQILGGYRRRLINGGVYVYNLQDGTQLWHRTLENVGLPLDQPRHVPLLILNYTRQEPGQAVPSGVLTCYDARTGDVLHERTDHSHIYYSLLASRPEEWVEMRLKQRSVYFDYGTGD